MVRYARVRSPGERSGPKREWIQGVASSGLFAIARRRKEQVPLDTTLLRKQAWELKLMAHLSSLYYQLTVKNLRWWNLVGKLASGVIVLVAVALAARWPDIWVLVAGGVAIPAIGVIVEILLTSSRINSAQALYEKWADLSHDTNQLWDEIHTPKPIWEALAPRFRVLDERMRHARSLECTLPSQRRRMKAERMLYSELELPYD